MPSFDLPAKSLLSVIGLALVLCGFVCGWWFLWHHPAVGPVFQTTCRIAWGTWWRCLLAGSTLAFFLFRWPLPGRRFLLAVLVGWSFLSLGLLTVSWKSAWQRPGNWADRTVAWGGGFWQDASATQANPARFPDASRTAQMRGEPAVIWIHLCATLPWCVWLFGMAMCGSHGDIEDLLRTERRGWWVHVLWRRWLAVALLLGLWILTGAMNEIAASDVFYVRTYAEEIYLGFPLGDTATLNPLRTESAAQFPGLAHGVAIVTTGLALGLVLTWLSSDWSHARMRPNRSIRKNWASWPISLAVFLVVGFCLLIPLGELVRQVGTTVRWDGETARSVWDARHATRQWLSIPRQLRGELGWSLAISSLATVGTFLISHGLCWWLNSRRRLWPLAGTLVGVLWAIPAPLIGVNLLQLVDDSGLAWLRTLANQSLLLPVVSLVLYLLPLSVVCCWLLTRRIPETLLEAAKTEQTWSLGRWYRTAIRPQLTWQLALLWFLFVMGMNDITATNLVLPAGTDTMARRILGLVHAGVDDQVAAAAIWSYLLSGVLGLTVFFSCLRRDET